MTQLDEAIKAGDCAAIATIVERGGLVIANHETEEGLTAIIKCSMSVDRDSVKRLVKAGADINRFNKHGMNALMWACKRDDLIMVHELLDLGAAPVSTNPHITILTPNPQNSNPTTPQLPSLLYYRFSRSSRASRAPRA